MSKFTDARDEVKLEIGTALLRGLFSVLADKLLSGSKQRTQEDTLEIPPTAFKEDTDGKG